MVDNLTDIFGRAHLAVEKSDNVLDIVLSDAIKDMPGCPLPLSGTVGLYDADRMAKWIYDIWLKGDKG